MFQVSFLYSSFHHVCTLVACKWGLWEGGQTLLEGGRRNQTHTVLTRFCCKGLDQWLSCNNSSCLSLKGLLLPILLVTVCLQSRSPCTMCFFVLIQTFSSHLTGTSRNFWIFTMMYLYLASSSISTGCLLPHHFRMPWNQVLDSARSLQLFLTHVPEVALQPRYFKGIWYLSECFHPPLYNVTPAICSQRSTQKRK